MRNLRGKTWHAWAFYAADPNLKGFFYWAEAQKPTKRPTPQGEWLRVKFVPVDPIPSRFRQNVDALVKRKRMQ